MDLVQIDGESAQLQLSYAELVLINNALNEVLNGFDISEFQTRLGAPVDDAKGLLDQVGGLLDRITSSLPSPEEVDDLSEEILDWLDRVSELGDPPPWRAMVEGRDHESGDSFIQVGPDDDRDEDMYVSRDSGPAGHNELDLIAGARNYLPLLLTEIRRRRSGRTS